MALWDQMKKADAKASAERKAASRGAPKRDKAPKARLGEIVATPGLIEAGMAIAGEGPLAGGRVVSVTGGRKKRTATPSGERRGRPSGSPYADRTPVLVKLDPEMVEWLDGEYVRRKQPSRVDLIRAILDEARGLK